LEAYELLARASTKCPILNVFLNRKHLHQAQDVLLLKQCQSYSRKYYKQPTVNAVPTGLERIDSKHTVFHRTRRQSGLSGLIYVPATRIAALLRLRLYGLSNSSLLTGRGQIATWMLCHS
jgi:hypothetical protein